MEIKIKPKCNSVQQQMHGGVSRVTRPLEGLKIIGGKQ